MRIGRLTHRVTLQSSSGSADSFGQPSPVWSSVGTYWAQVSPLSGREAERARQVRADTTHTVTMRDVYAITPEMRLLYGSRVLNVVEVRNIDEADKELRLTCSEVLSGSAP